MRQIQSPDLHMSKFLSTISSEVDNSDAACTLFWTFGVEKVFWASNLNLYN